VDRPDRMPSGDSTGSVKIDSIRVEVSDGPQLLGWTPGRNTNTEETIQ
jgi:hypothetical protein